ncbi:MAG: hypothetical protein ACFFDT_10135 [Candidatus Hodarchaeota archaeon]
MVETLLREHVKLLKPKLIWIEYRTIPILSIARTIRDIPHLASHFYFLEIKALENLDQVLKSRALLAIYNQGFSTLIIDVPSYYSFPLDFPMRFHELMNKVNMILIMDELVLPQTQVNLIQVKSEE